jgi:hypothetical protein
MILRIITDSVKWHGLAWIDRNCGPLYAKKRNSPGPKEAGMADTLAAVPFHLSITEPIDEATITGYPTVEGAYDPVEQLWKLPTGTPLTGPKVIEDVQYDTPTYTIIHDSVNVDDHEFEN